MIQYEAMIEHTKRLDEEIKRNIEEREKARQTRNKAFLVFAEDSFVKGFDTMQEIENYFFLKSLELWNKCRADNELLGYVPKCSVSSYKEAKDRVKNYYSVKENVA